MSIKYQSISELLEVNGYHAEGEVWVRGEGLSKREIPPIAWVGLSVELFEAKAREKGLLDSAIGDERDDPDVELIATTKKDSPTFKPWNDPSSVPIRDLIATKKKIKQLAAIGKEKLLDGTEVGGDHLRKVGAVDDPKSLESLEALEPCPYCGFKEFNMYTSISQKLPAVIQCNHSECWLFTVRGVDYASCRAGWNSVAREIADSPMPAIFRNVMGPFPRVGSVTMQSSPYLVYKKEDWFKDQSGKRELLEKLESIKITREPLAERINLRELANHTPGPLPRGADDVSETFGLSFRELGEKLAASWKDAETKDKPTS